MHPCYAQEVPTHARGTSLRACDVELPEPSRFHATCAWCREDRHSIDALLDHVVAAHLRRTEPSTEAPVNRADSEI